LWILYRHRKEVLWTNPGLFLLHGNRQILTSVGIESMVGSSDWFSLALALNNLHVYALGQVALENQGARLNWVLPLGFSESDPLPELLDALTREAGLRGAKFITASARVDDCLFETLRRAGYAPCGWHSVWVLPQNFKAAKSQKISWFKPDSGDAFDLTLLQRRLLSHAARSIASIEPSTLPDFALMIDGALKGYAKVDQFGNKVLITPYIMKTQDELASILEALTGKFFPTAEKIYLLQTAESEWFTGELENIATCLTPRQELLVKHLTALQKLPATEFNHAANGHRVDTVTPILPSARRKDNI
jgi:hypothetical protein